MSDETTFAVGTRSTSSAQPRMCFANSKAASLATPSALRMLTEIPNNPSVEKCGNVVEHVPTSFRERRSSDESAGNFHDVFKKRT